MPKPSQHAVTALILVAILFIVGLLAGLMARPARPGAFFSPPTKGVALHDLGRATNYLKLDREHSWRAFSISNGTSRTMFYAVTEVEYRTPEGWRSAGRWLANTLTNSSLITRRDTAGEMAPGTTDVFYASIATTNVPWRLRVGCFESGWSDSISRFTAKMRGSSSTVKSWSGRRYELVGEEITP